MKRLLLILIFILALALRLYKLNTPLADWHSWRQVDTASVSRRFCNQGIDILRPRYHDLSNIPSGMDNPEGWRMVEMPVYNAAHCLFSKVVLPLGLSFEASGRLISVLFSLASGMFLYLLVKKLSTERLALSTSFFWAVLPFNLYYSRVILPEPLLITLSLSWFYFFVLWMEKNSHLSYLLSWFSFALGILIKPYLVFWWLPLLVLFFKKWRQKKVSKIQIYQFFGFALTLVPFFWWRAWIKNFPEGIPAYMWLLNQNNIRLRPAWFRWLFADRLGRLITGYWGLSFLVLGVAKKSKNAWFYLWWLASGLAYLVVFAAGNVTHDYYQTILMPIVCILLAKGFLTLLSLAKQKQFNSLIIYHLSFITILFMLAFSWFNVKDFYNINHPEIVSAGERADQVLPSDAKVIAPYNGDTAFLYQTNRIGWPQGFEINKKINLGATHYVSVNFDGETNELMQKCQVLEKTSDFVIINLTQCN